MDSGDLVGLSTAIIAGLLVLTGYLLNQLANRRERKRKVYAEALEAIREYQELHTRCADALIPMGPTRAALGDRIGDVVSKLWFYRALLRLTLLDGSWLFRVKSALLQPLRMSRS